MSEPLLNREGTIVYRKDGTKLASLKVNIYREFGKYSMNKRAVMKKYDFAAAQQLFSPVQSPFGVKFLYDYGLW
jgi:hypothetical protein